MKCVKRKNVKHEEVIRVSDEDAVKLVASGNWHYTSKGSWKRNGREQ